MSDTPRQPRKWVEISAEDIRAVNNRAYEAFIAQVGQLKPAPIADEAGNLIMPPDMLQKQGTLLMAYCRNGCPAIPERLQLPKLLFNAASKVTDEYGHTILTYAMLGKQTGIALALIEAEKSRPDVLFFPDVLGETSLEVAMHRGDKACLTKLAGLASTELLTEVKASGEALLKSTHANPADQENTREMLPVLEMELKKRLLAGAVQAQPPVVVVTPDKAVTPA